jgi:hypothetical protein
MEVTRKRYVIGVQKRAKVNMKSSKFLSQRGAHKANHNSRMEGYFSGTDTHLWGKRELRQGLTGLAGQHN